MREANLELIKTLLDDYYHEIHESVEADRVMKLIARSEQAEAVQREDEESRVSPGVAERIGEDETTVEETRRKLSRLPARGSDPRPAPAGA